MDYFDWLHSLVDLFVKELEKRIGKNFVRDEEMTLGAAKHSETMMKEGRCFWISGQYTGPALAPFSKIQFVQEGIAYYNQLSIEQTLKEMAQGILGHISPEFRPVLPQYHFIGVGIAIRKDEQGKLYWDKKTHGEIFIYVTVRLRT